MGQEFPRRFANDPQEMGSQVYPRVPVPSDDVDATFRGQRERGSLEKLLGPSDGAADGRLGVSVLEPDFPTLDR